MVSIHFAAFISIMYIIKKISVLLSLILSVAIINAKEVIVTVTTSSSLSEILTDDELLNADSIKVYGTLSDYDFSVLQKMTVSYKLRHIDLYNTTNTSIGSNAFESSPLKSIILPHNCKSIGYLSFSHCSNLQSIELGDNLQYMNNGALRCCYNLKQITFPASLLSIGTQCMDYTPFTDIYCLGSNPASASSNAWTCYSSCTLHVPLNAKSAYEYANGWMNFTNIVEENFDNPDMPKCDNPTIKFINGKLIFECATENVNIISEVTSTDTQRHHGSVVPITAIYTVRAYATKDGYEDSDIVTKEINIRGIKGDVNDDGEVNIADINSTIEIILSD